MNVAMVLAIVGLVCNVIALVAFARGWVLHKRIVANVTAERDKLRAYITDLQNRCDAEVDARAKAVNERGAAIAAQESMSANLAAARQMVDELVEEKARMSVDLTTTRHLLAEALRQKASQFEAWQAESTNLRADVAALERKCEAMKTDRDRFWSHLDATRDRLASAESDLRAAYAELALLRPIADSAEKLLDDEKFPGEWAPVRAAIRARKEAQP